jgi:hypothetical protein
MHFSAISVSVLVSGGQKAGGRKQLEKMLFFSGLVALDELDWTG